MALRLSFALVAALVAALAGCVATPADEAPPACTGKCDGAGAPSALREHLLANLHAQMDTGRVLFGQQRFNLTGVEQDGTQWLATATELDRSDARTVAGDEPIVMGFDAWDLAMKPETWAPSPAVHAAAARAVFARGGVVTMDWHMRGCAVDSFNAPGNEACLCKIANDDTYARAWLVDVHYAKLADALERHGLDELPIVFRPLHEHDGAWFWWGKPYWNCTAYGASPRFTGAAAYQRVYRMIVDYLREERGLDNLLVAYSPVAAPDANTFLAGYPGDAYVDILGLDLYWQRTSSFAAQTATFRGYVATITRLARERGKVAALTEVGNTLLAGETAGQSRWYMDHLLPLVRDAGLAYAMTWENRTSGAQQFWVPYPTHPGVADFRAFAASPVTVFASEVPALYEAPARYPTCASCSADPDGDRWGWEHEQSCRMASWCL